jgi:chloride channel 3/4/5
VILVEERGRLVGLVTVKDVLRFTERAEEDAAASGEAAGTDAVSDALEEGWTWAGGRAASALEWARRRVGR